MDASYEITDDLKHDVLAATDLVALVGAVTGLKKAGSSWKGLCPFHGEKTPSFHVHPERGFYYCFGCGAKGDAITFVRETEKLEFPEAVAYLARRAGIALPARRSGPRADRAKETRVAEALVGASRFFREQLPRSRAAIAVLEGRGVPRDEWDALGFGAAPDAWDGLLRALSGSFTEEVLLEAGLLQKNPDTGRVYDRFRNRLTLEIRDPRGEVLAFGGRALGDDPAKYINNPETSRFTKGRVLYGLDRARESARRSEKLVLCEGYFDRIAFERAGVPWAVASMGTALTTTQADLLARQVPAVVVAYDGDAAGLAAAWKAFPLLVERGVRVFHVAFPGGHDPDSYLRAEGAPALRRAVETARPLLEVLAASVPPATGDAAERAERINQAKAILSAAPDQVLRFELLNAFSRAAGVPLELLRDPGKRSRIGPDAAARVAKPTDPSLPETEAKLLRIVLVTWPKDADWIPYLRTVSAHDHTHAVLATLSTLHTDEERIDIARFSAPEDGTVARLLAQPEEVLAGESIGNHQRNLIHLALQNGEKKKASMTREIAAAEASRDTVRVGTLMAEKVKLSRELAQVGREFRGPA